MTIMGVLLLIFLAIYTVYLATLGVEKIDKLNLFPSNEWLDFIVKLILKFLWCILVAIGTIMTTLLIIIFTHKK
jgi:hypothetical protein